MVFNLTPFNLILGGLWTLSIILNYAEYCYLWQLKEYRLDRMRDFFSTRQGRDYWLNWHNAFRFIAALLTMFWPFNDAITLKLAVSLALLFDLSYYLLRAWHRILHYPRPTAKASLLLLSAIIIEVGLLLDQRDWSLIFFLMFLRFPIMSTLVWFWNQISLRAKQFIIYRATSKIAKQNNLTVIGITGSYGKSTVKEYLAQILSTKYKVVKTPGNINTDIGVAKFILSADFTGVEMFVCEMGAYRIGEIDKICQIVKPKVGILTTIIEQHLSLFGSIKNIQTAKYELLRSIPANGLVITNADNPYCTEFLAELTCQNQALFGDDPDNAPTDLIEVLETDSEGIRWQVGSESGVQIYFAPLRGAHQALNITPAMMAARYLGVPEENLIEATGELKPGPNSLRVYKYREATIIDDSYNSNPKGFKAALDILSSFSSKQKRIVITRGMLELADKSAEYHEQIGEEIAFCADELVIISPDSAADLLAGVQALKNKFPLEVKLIFSHQDLLEFINERSETPVVILLENRLPALVMNEIRQ